MRVIITTFERLIWPLFKDYLVQSSCTSPEIRMFVIRERRKAINCISIGQINKLKF